MKLLDFIFRLGVEFAIFSFIWGIFNIGLSLLRAGQKRSLIEIYSIRGLKYFFLVNVTFLFCQAGIDSNMLVINQVVFSGIILLFYFVGKLQQKQQQSSLFKVAGAIPNMSKMPNLQGQFNLKGEIIIISISIAALIGFSIFPEYAANSIAIYFRDTIINIEDTPFFGFIFKVIGFFFLMNIISKMAKTIGFILTGGKLKDNNIQDNNGPSLGDDQNDTHFDNYEEVKD